MNKKSLAWLDLQIQKIEGSFKNNIAKCVFLDSLWKWHEINKIHIYKWYYNYNNGLANATTFQSLSIFLYEWSL